MVDLVGSLPYGKIINSYTTASVSGNYAVGGLVGKSSNGIIENSYSSGTVTKTGTEPKDIGGVNRTR